MKYSSTQMVWVENGMMTAIVKKNSMNNWKVSKSNGFPLGTIHKDGTLIGSRKYDLSANDLRTLHSVHNKIKSLLK